MPDTIGTKTLTPVERIEQWIAALRSGMYRQTDGYLHDTVGYCCLGVLCDTYMPNAWVLDPERADRGVYMFDGETFGLPATVANATRLHATDRLTLADMNDGERKSFAEIADHIESIILPRVRREQEGR